MGWLRRNLLTRALPLALVGMSGRPFFTPHGAMAAQSQTAADEWMQDYLERIHSHPELKKRLEGVLQLQRFPGGMYALLTPLRWTPRGQQQGLPVAAPRLFVSDLASVPRPFWALFPRDGDYAYAAVLHDYLYWVQDRPRVDADQIFRYAMDDLRIKDRDAEVLYRAVALFGESAWQANADLKRAGERRVLKRLPDDPTISWDDWKRRPEAF